MGPLRTLAAAVCLLSGAFGCGAGESKATVCRTRATGVNVGTTINICPAIVDLRVTPREASVGSDVQLSVAATDPDSEELSYLWTPAEGSVANPDMPNTSYRCTSVGPHGLTLTVSDGQCDDSEMVFVVCVP